MSEVTFIEPAVEEPAKGFPIVDGLKLTFNGETVTVKNGELHLAGGNNEQTFHHHLRSTDQVDLYDGKFKLKYDSLGRPLPWEEQSVSLDDIDIKEAHALGVLTKWEQNQAKKAKLKK